MANLLTVEARKSLKNDFLHRKLIVVSIAGVLLLLVAIIIWLTFWFSLLIEKRSLGVREENLPVDEQREDFAPVVDQSETIANAKELKLLWSEPLASTLITKAIELKPSMIKLNGFALSRQKEGESTRFSLTGSTTSRGDLVSYVNFLRQSGLYSRVDLPVENLISDKGGPFILNLEK